MHKVYLSLGSNLGDKHAQLTQALDLLDERAGVVCRVSHFVETEPVGFESDNQFLNCVCLLHTTLSPRELLNETQSIERQLGRREKSIDGHYKDRLIDIDILTYDNLHIDEPGLKIPHPHMHERSFVMEPLQEIISPTDTE